MRSPIRCDMYYKRYVIILILFSQCAWSESYLLAGAWSKHFIPNKYHEVNEMIGFEHDGFMFTKFINSYKDTGFFFGKIKYYKPRIGLIPHLRYGIALGYDFFAIPGAAPGFTILLNNKGGLDCSIVPGVAGICNFKILIGN